MTKYASQLPQLPPEANMQSEAIVCGMSGSYCCWVFQRVQCYFYCTWILSVFNFEILF